MSRVTSSSSSSRVSFKSDYDKTLVLINPLISCRSYEFKDTRGLPSVDLIKSLTDKRIRVVMVDSDFERKIAKSVIDEHPGFEKLDSLKSEMNININFTMVQERPSQWNWRLQKGRDDIRDDANEIVYIDYAEMYYTPPEITDELLVMHQVGDYKWRNRKYLRRTPYDLLSNIFSSKIEATPWFDWENAPRIRDNKLQYKMLMKSARYYVLNKFHKDDVDIPYGMNESNIISSNITYSYPLVLSHPLLEGFVYHYDIMPDLPMDDKHAYRSTGWTPTKLMTDSGQYRRVMTDSLTRVLSHLIVRDGLMDPMQDWLIPETWDTAIATL